MEQLRQTLIDVTSDNKWILFTEKFILVILGIIIVVDLFLAWNQVDGDTISEVLQEWAYSRFFVLSWAWGVLAGHLFLARETALFGQPDSVKVLLGLSLGLFVIGQFVRVMVSIPLQLVLLVLGTVAGYLLWPQRPLP